MRNTDFLVYLVTRSGSTTRFNRDSKGWVQTAPSGIKRRCTAEQVLNHLLPALALGDSVVKARVKLRAGKRFHPRLENIRNAGTSA
ncbi:MAG TPA: hypothetical protein VJR06_04525 [Nitrososphaerales archaeon]|nr:hypothetical protein [Nitrososphaerales archaeon]